MEKASMMDKDGIVRTLGVVKGDVYESHRVTKTHYFVIGKGYPVTSELLKNLVGKGVKIIRLVVQQADKVCVYETEIENYLNAKEFAVGGFESQRCYELSKMRKVS